MNIAIITAKLSDDFPIGAVNGLSQDFRVLLGWPDIAMSFTCEKNGLTWNLRRVMSLSLLEPAKLSCPYFSDVQAEGYHIEPIQNSSENNEYQPASVCFRVAHTCRWIAGELPSLSKTLPNI